tara:strand:+ start:774 stop:1538 length:765 start_codon:yes stop_codon:yes gene_type:complete
MAKIYTHYKKKEKNIASNDDWNQESQQIFSEFNGQLSGDQLPFEGVEQDNFKNPTRQTGFFTRPDGSQTNGVGWVGNTDAYYITSEGPTEFTYLREAEGSLSTTILGPPVKTFSSDSPSWASSITPLSQFYNSGAFLRVPTKEGMLKGCATLDTEYYGFGRRIDGVTGNYGTEGRVQLYVFVNDIMVATTGPQPAGKRQTYQLNFAIPVGASENTDIDIRISATFDLDNPEGFFPEPAKVIFYSSQLWVRNQYR